MLAFLREEKESGREIVLATASEKQVAQSVADHLGIFSAVCASDGRVNLSGTHKQGTLERRYGRKGFGYIGNSKVDLPIWEAADQALLVQPSSGLLQKARQVSSVHRVFSIRKQRFPVFLKALRVMQWVKNILVFVPLLMAHKIAEPALAQHAICAFLVFNLCASSVYIVNDLLDLESDRQHPRKKNRPFAAGALEIKTGVLLAPLLLVSSFVISFKFLPLLYEHPAVLWLIAPFLLYWITRIWFKAHRGEMDDDLIVLEVKDPLSYAVAAVVAVILVLASL